MEHVITLLKRRKESAKLELSYCEEGNEHYNKARKKLNDEIEQIDKSLLILSNVVGQSEQLLFSPDDIERIVNEKSMFNGKQLRKMFEK